MGKKVYLLDKDVKPLQGIKIHHPIKLMLFVCRRLPHQNGMIDRIILS